MPFLSLSLLFLCASPPRRALPLQRVSIASPHHAVQSLRYSEPRFSVAIRFLSVPFHRFTNHSFALALLRLSTALLHQSSPSRFFAIPMLDISFAACCLALPPQIISALICCNSSPISSMPALHLAIQVSAIPSQCLAELFLSFAYHLLGIT